MGGPWCTFKRSRGPNVPADNYQLTPGFLTHILCRTFHPSSWNLTSRCFGDLVFVYVSFEVLPLSRAKVNRTWIDFTGRLAGLDTDASKQVRKYTFAN